MANNLVYGFGVNDADYVVKPSINGIVTWCPFYKKWLHMIERCYSKKCHNSHPSYAGCRVCSEWLTFSNFKSWMSCQDWVGMELDKDVIVSGNKTYGPEFCSFVDSMTNSFITDSSSIRGQLPIGVGLSHRNKKYRSYCRNPFTKKAEHLGYFDCEKEAHEAWRSRKHELACQLANLQINEVVANALRKKYLY